MTISSAATFTVNPLPPPSPWELVPRLFTDPTVQTCLIPRLQMVQPNTVLHLTRHLCPQACERRPDSTAGESDSDHTTVERTSCDLQWHNLRHDSTTGCLSNGTAFTVTITKLTPSLSLTNFRSGNMVHLLGQPGQHWHRTVLNHRKRAWQSQGILLPRQRIALVCSVIPTSATVTGYLLRSWQCENQGAPLRN